MARKHEDPTDRDSFEDLPWEFSGLRALFLNCTLREAGTRFGAPNPEY